MKKFQTDFGEKETAPAPRIDIEAAPGDCTAALQAALDTALVGPAHLRLGPGRHLSGGLRIRSDTTLELAPGAELAFIPDYGAYADNVVAVVAEQSDRAMLSARGAARITICGGGRIACDGAARFTSGDDGRMGTRQPVARRPRVLVFDGCSDVVLSDFTVCDSPMWTLHLIDCTDVTLSRLTVDNDRRLPNTDGLVLDGCRRVTVQACEIRTGDAGIVLKTSARADGRTTGPCADIRVSGCTVESRSCALKIGTESHADFRDIVFEECRIEASNRALGIFSRDGGAISNLRFSSIHLDCVETPDGFWGSGEPVTVNALDRRPDRPAGPIRDIEFRDITGRAPGAINLVGERPGMLAGIVLDRIDLDQFEGDLGTARRYDLRPTPADLAPPPEGAGRANAWRLDARGDVVGLVPYPDGLPGLYALHVAALTLGDIRIARPVPLPPTRAVDPVQVRP